MLRSLNFVLGFFLSIPVIIIVTLLMGFKLFLLYLYKKIRYGKIK
jgi:hypothetical protein